MAKCGQCGFKGGGQEYLEHICSTGFKPTQIEHQDALTGGQFSKISEAALKRGADRKTEAVKKIVGAPIAKKKRK